MAWPGDRAGHARRAHFPHPFDSDLDLQRARAYLSYATGTLYLHIPRKEVASFRVHVNLESDESSSCSSCSSSGEAPEEVVVCSEHVPRLAAEDLCLQVLGRILKIKVLKEADSWENAWIYANLNKTVPLPGRFVDLGSIQATYVENQLKEVVPGCAMRQPKYKRLHVCLHARCCGNPLKMGEAKLPESKSCQMVEQSSSHTMRDNPALCSF